VCCVSSCVLRVSTDAGPRAGSAPAPAEKLKRCAIFAVPRDRRRRIGSSVQPEAPKVLIFDFSNPGALSLTPCFSGVLRANRGTVNRFNGFGRSPWFHRVRGRKPLKRFTPPRRSPSIPLKQGVNERRAAAGKI